MKDNNFKKIGKITSFKNFKGYLIILMYVVLFLFPSCLHNSKITNNGNESLLRIQIIDKNTNEPIQNALAILVNIEPSLGQYEGAYRKEIFSDYLRLDHNGLFRYSNKKANGKEIWFLAPGYKSVPVEYSYENKDDSLALKIIANYLMQTEYAPVSTLGFLLGILQTTTIKYEFTENLASIPLTKIDNDLDLWEAEINVGLYELKEKIADRAILIFNDFVANEKKELGRAKTLE